MEDYSYSANRGEYFLIVGWILTSLAIVAVLVRLYSRLVVTRSAGSDDFFISWCLPLTLFGQIGDSIAVHHGLGRHQKYLTQEQISSITKWEYIDLIEAFTSLFFLRCSIMLFTLRLMPKSKKWPQYIIIAAFLLNFAITILVTVTYGTKCVPFTAIYKSVPGARCTSQNIQVITQQLNGVLACIIDITTALIPAFLLYKIKIKRKTKIILDIIFFLGLITAGLSIGRAATTNTGIWKEDMTWRIMPPNTFSMIEEKLGIILACAPALRQYFTYIKRTGSPWHTSGQRQPPNSDFIGFRQRVRWRDVLWYNNSGAFGLSDRSRTATATATQTPTSAPKTDLLGPTPHSIRSGTHNEAIPSDAKHSPLDTWTSKLKRLFSPSHSQTEPQRTSRFSKRKTPLSTSEIPLSHSRGASAVRSSYGEAYESDGYKTSLSKSRSHSNPNSPKNYAEEAELPSPDSSKYEKRASRFEPWEWEYVRKTSTPLQKPSSHHVTPPASTSALPMPSHPAPVALPLPDQTPHRQPPVSIHPGAPSTLSMTPNPAPSSPLSDYVLPGEEPPAPSVAFVQQRPRVVNVGHVGRGGWPLRNANGDG